jgi:hypothetical protein
MNGSGYANGAQSYGGGGYANFSAGGLAGLSGIVVIRYAGSPQGTGGTRTTSGGYTRHVFTSSGILQFE